MSAPTAELGATVEWEPENLEQAKTEPGAMARRLTRYLPGGASVLFEEAPKGWLTKAGDPRKVPWRAYHYTDPTARKVRFPSTTGLIDLILSKPGLPPWSEARGIEGFLKAIQDGSIDPMKVTAEQAIESVRALKLGAEAAKNEAAERGINVHSLLENYMLTGTPPTLAGHPKEHHGYIVALAGWLVEKQPEPVAVEQLVVSPEEGYAGRLDLRAMIGGQLVTVDIKTQEKAAIYPGAHYQVALYERAAIQCGDQPADRKMVVVFAADGKHREMAADHDDWRIDAALAHYRGAKPINAACESHNRHEKAERAAA